MSTTSKPLRWLWNANRVERAITNPGRYAKNRAKSKAMSAVGIWSLWRGWWKI
jgi:hypothetical protein